jgi:hypothetical protein
VKCLGKSCTPNSLSLRHNEGFQISNTCFSCSLPQTVISIALKDFENTHVVLKYSSIKTQLQTLI